MTKRILMVALVCGLCLSGVAVAQDLSADPLYGTVEIEAGFSNDPRTVDVLAGGNDDADELDIQDAVTGDDAVGFINSAAPDVRVQYSSGTFSLRFYVECEEDTTLLVNLPNTDWRVNDDGQAEDYIGLCPIITLEDPPDGQYDLWIGTYDPGSNPEATLFITELMSNVPSM